MHKSKPRAKRRIAHRNHVFVATTCVAAAIAFIATTQLTTPWLHFGTPVERLHQVNPKEIRTATIARQTGDKQCALAEFDNDTGQITDARGCKNTTVLDGRGMPVPMGTVHRLDSISKSFLGNTR